LVLALDAREPWFEVKVPVRSGVIVAVTLARLVKFSPSPCNR
jgi:hypothetical protein